MIDLMTNDAFSVGSLVAAINKIKTVPGKIGSLGLFEPKPIATTTAQVELLNGMLQLLTSRNRGETGTAHRRAKRKIVPMSVPYIPVEDTVLPEEVQNVRQFGSEDQMSGVVEVVNQHLAEMKASVEATWEWLRLGAIKGIVYDGDGTTSLANLFTLFGLAQPSTVDFVLGTATTDIESKVLEAAEAVENGLQGMTHTSKLALCGRTFFRKFKSHAKVKDAYRLQQESSFLRNDLRSVGFDFCGVTFVEYNVKLGGIPWIAANACQFIPLGAPGAFIEAISPGNFNEATNTLGQPIYAKMENRRFGMGVDIHVESSVLPICTVPNCLVPGTTSN